MVMKAGRRQVSPEAVARWKALTSDQERLRAAYAPLAADDVAMAEAGIEDLARSLDDIDHGRE